MKNLQKKLKKGFTLVEMLVVVAIIGVLSTVLYTSYTRYISSSKYAVVKAEALEIVEVFETAMVANQGIGRSADEDITEENFYTFDELLNMDQDIEVVYNYISDSALPATASIAVNADGTAIIYTNRGVEVIYNPSTQAFTSVRTI